MGRIAVDLDAMSPSLLLQKYLVAAYGYYVCDESLMTDHEFDAIAKRLLAEWDTLEHRHKHLLDKSSLDAGTCLIPTQAYPGIVVGCAERLMGRKGTR